MSTTPVLEGVVVDSAPIARRVFGREPAAWVGLIEALLAFLVLFPAVSALGLTQEWATLVLAVVSAAAGVYTAWATRDTALAAILGLIKAAVGLTAFYGFALDTAQQAALLAAVAVVVGFFQRTQTTPVDAPLNPSPTQVINTVNVPSALPVEGEPAATTAESRPVVLEPADVTLTPQGAVVDGVLDMGPVES